MKINKLELLYFRCFKEYKLELSDRFTLLIGNNGSGKTALLDALQLCINPFVYQLLNRIGLPAEHWIKNAAWHIQDSDIYYELLVAGQTPIKEPVSPTKISIEATIFNENFDSSISNIRDCSLDPNNKSSDLQYLAYRLNPLDVSTLFPIIAYYGTGRLWREDTESIDTSKPGSRLLGYNNCLTPSLNLKQLFSWFKTQELAALQKKERRHVLEAVRQAIVDMVPDASHAWWDFDWAEILIELKIQDKSKTIPFHLLSDGYRNMIGMVADIAYRMATLNPQLEADVIKQTEGIVLIDEIDLHLHPKWQREVVGRLLKTFPKVQFVASSHSPFIIQSLYGREDCLLWDLEKAAPLSIESKSIEDIAENQQGVEIPQQSQRFLAMEKAAEEYYRVLKKIPPATYDEKQRLKQRLDELLLPFSDDPAFQAFLKMEREAALPTDESK